MDNKIFKDLDGIPINIDDEVLYARKRNYTANGELVKCIVKKINEHDISLESNKTTYRSTDQSSQIYIIKQPITNDAN